jgi:CBS domain-containing protein
MAPAEYRVASLSRVTDLRLKEAPMVATEKPLFDLTAADLMTPMAITLDEAQPLREAAEALLRAGIHGAPVVNALGECTGVLSVTDLARWAARGAGPSSPRPQACSHQEAHRAVRGGETALCTRPAGACSFQAPTVLAGGRVAQACRKPPGTYSEWQSVELDALPAEDVRHYMTSDPIAVGPEAPIGEVARVMLDTGIQRVVVLGPGRRPAGVVSTTDLVAALVSGDGETVID